MVGEWKKTERNQLNRSLGLEMIELLLPSFFPISWGSQHLLQKDYMSKQTGSGFFSFIVWIHLEQQLLAFLLRLACASQLGIQAHLIRSEDWL